MTLKKPTREKPVRGIFIVSELQRKFFYNNHILNKNSQTYLRKFLEQNSFRTTPNCSSILVPEIRRVYDCHNIKCCTDCLENHPLFPSLLYGFLCNNCTLKTMPRCLGMRVVSLLYGLSTFCSCTDSKNTYRTTSIKL
jgi:hypothetical protein